MTQELTNLKNSILEERYADALAMIDELEAMSRQAILRQIGFFISRLLIGLIKNQVEQRLTNAWAASISDSIRQIKKLNSQGNKTTYYITIHDWEPIIEDEFEAAIDAASVETLDGIYSPFQLAKMVDKTQVTLITQNFLFLTYDYPIKELPAIVKENLVQLVGGEAWKKGRWD
jgi:hypothetical protein